MDFEYVYQSGSGFKKSQLPKELNPLADNEILIQPKYVGICGSDLYLLELGKESLRLGHEWVGTVVDTGSLVKGLQVGDSVTGTGYFACEVCEHCLAGKANLCSNSVHFSSDKIGALRSHFKARESQVFKLKGRCVSAHPLLEVLAVAEEAYAVVPKQELKTQGPILIFGGGSIGMSVGLVFQNYGHQVLILETIPERVLRCQQAGLEAMSLGEALVSGFAKAECRTMIDCSNDYSGTSGAFKYIDYFSAKSFFVLVIGKYIESQKIPLSFNSKSAKLEWLRGVSVASMEKAIFNWESRIDFIAKTLVSHVLSLDELDKAFTIAKDRAACMKVVIDLGGQKADHLSVL